MKLNYLITGVLILWLTSCTKEYSTVHSIGNPRVEIDITQYGLVGDGKTDCSDLINQIIQDLPASGGVIIIPEGDFVLDHPIQINRNYVTIKGINPVMESSTDIDALLTESECSRLILRNAEYAIHFSPVASVNGAKNRISGAEVKDLLISGGDSYKGTGIFMEHDNDRCKVVNVTGSHLEYGIRTSGSDALMISDCQMFDVTNGIVMNGGIQNMITNCRLGAQLSGVACKLTGETNLLFSNNRLNPRGDKCLLLDNCSRVNIADNEIESSYVGMLDLKGSYNLVKGNNFLMTDIAENQLLQYDAEYGAIRLSGDANLFSDNEIVCKWNTTIENPVTVNAVEGENNRFMGCMIENKNSNRVFYISELSEVIDCGVSEENIMIKPIDRDLTKVGYVITYDTPEEIEDDDEKSSYAWFKKQFVNGKVITPAMLTTEDLSAYDVIWIHIDRVGIGAGCDKLPLSTDEVAALAAYYKKRRKFVLK